MLCNIYIKESTEQLKNIGIRSSSPVFFINVSDMTYNKLKSMEVKGTLEIHMVQNDPYLKDLSDKFINGGVQLPEIRIVERIVQAPPITIEKTIEVPVEVEVIKEVEVIREVIKEVEVIREVPVVTESTSVEVYEPLVTKEDEEGILIDTKVAFEDWKSKNAKAPVIKEEYVEGDTMPHKHTHEQDVDIDFLPGVNDLVVPEVVINPLEEEDTTMPILVGEEEVVEPTPIEIEPAVKTTAKRSRKKKEVEELPVEFVVELTPDEEKKYKDVKVEE